MNYDSLIRNWHIKASEEDYFSKFVFEYLAFIAFLRKRKFTEARTDRDAIQRLKRDARTKTDYLATIEKSAPLKKAWEKLREELDHSPLGNTSGSSGEVEEIKWWNCSHSCLEEKSPEETQKVKGAIAGPNDWENMVEYWSAIRNNLFHGTKDPQDRRDQILVRNGYISLCELVEILLAEQPT